VWTSLYETWYVCHGIWAHLNGVLNKSQSSVCVSVCVSPIVARQRLVTAVINAHAAIEELLNALFSVRCANIPIQQLQRVNQNLFRWCEGCLRVEGQLFQHLLWFVNCNYFIPNAIGQQAYYWCITSQPAVHRSLWSAKYICESTGKNTSANNISIVYFSNVSDHLSYPVVDYVKHRLNFCSTFSSKPLASKPCLT
jgi:hypothetical protein